jgi:hypothetical protein
VAVSALFRLMMKVVLCGGIVGGWFIKGGGVLIGLLYSATMLLNMTVFSIGSLTVMSFHWELRGPGALISLGSPILLKILFWPEVTLFTKKKRSLAREPGSSVISIGL